MVVPNSCPLFLINYPVASTNSVGKGPKNKAKMPKNYHFHPIGAGGVDGAVQLNNYDWGQVSIMRFPMDYILYTLMVSISSMVSDLMI